MPFSRSSFSGYPFDRDSDKDGYFRSQLDDIAKRHPEFAEHLGNFQKRGTGHGHTSATEDPDLNRHFTRPFGDRFERFGFPFDSDDFDPEQYAKRFYQPHQDFSHKHPTQQSTSQQQQQPTYQQSTSHQQQQPTHQQSTQQQPTYQQSTSHQQQQPTYREQAADYQEPQYYQKQEPAAETPTANPASAPERERSNIQQSNTIDLGQKQEPVNDRNQRSMSAPPAEKGQRFTSSIHIPVNQPGNSENMSHPQTQPETKGTERIIPIHIEGRDEPVLPRNVPNYSQPHQSYGSPQPERIFGQRPENFTQFIHREPRQFADNWASFPEEPVRQQRFQTQHNVPQFQQKQRPAQQKEDIPIPVHKTQDTPKQQRAVSPPTQAQQEHKPTPQQHKPLTPIEQIQVIQKDVSALMAQVDKFDGKSKDKQYLYLDEMLTRNLLKLDDVDTQGQDNIRSARKEAIRCIEKTIGILEAKAAATVAPPPPLENSMEVEEKQQPIETKDEAENENKEQHPMETQPEQTQNAEIQPMETEVVATDKEIKTNEEVQSSDLIPENPKDIQTETEVITNQSEVKPLEENPTENKPEQNETNEGQESNMAVADAVKMFDGSVDNKNDKIDNNNESENKPPAVSVEDDKKEEKTEEKKEEKTEKKEKKKGKKKVVNKEKEK